MKDLQIRLFTTLAVLLVTTFMSAVQAQNGTKPNIIVILADDMGYSDIGAYGSEIATPNIDQLANNGVRLKQFYNTGRCCPTRASLLTGLYPHKTGMGWMTGFDMNVPGYKGDLNNQCVTVAEALKPAGYSSYAVGKWHLSTNTKDEGPQHNWPLQRGFDNYYGIIAGSSSYFVPKSLANNNTTITTSGDYYLTDAISDTAQKYIARHASQKREKPFFMYVAYTAPHWPLHAKEKDIQKYMQKYAVGWDQLRKERYEKQRKLGIIDKSAKLTERDAEVPAWKDIPEKDKALWVKRMAIYAAQVDCMDQGIGRITTALKKNNLADNTMVIFLSDNGGCAEFLSNRDAGINALGTEESYESYRINWANLSNTPYKLYKSRVHEGGIIAPFVVSWPGLKGKKGAIANTPAHLIDLMPTFLEMAGAKYPTTYKGLAIAPLPGRSLLPVFNGQAVPARNLFWEHEANRAVRVNDWKLVSVSTQVAPYIQSWELYNLATDKSETTNLATKYPERVKEMEAAWNKWANENDVLPLNGEDMGLRGKTYKRKFR